MKKNNLQEQIFRIGDELTIIMDQLKEKNNHEIDERTKKEKDNVIKALASAQGQILKAYFSYESSFKVPQETGESLAHYVAKNKILETISLPQDIIPQVSVGGCRFDVLVRDKEDYVIVEAETKARALISFLGLYQ
jgi:hypothetical protein